MKARILIVDDEEMLLRALQRILHAYEVRSVASARAALELVASGEKFDVVLADAMLAATNAKKFYEALVALDAGLARRVLFMSGGQTNAQVDGFLRGFPYPLIEKPFGKIGILHAVHGALAQGVREPV